jgi:hypothetical protein
MWDTEERYVLDLAGVLVVSPTQIQSQKWDSSIY